MLVRVEVGGKGKKKWLTPGQALGGRKRSSMGVFAAVLLLILGGYGGRVAYKRFYIPHQKASKQRYAV